MSNAQELYQVANDLDKDELVCLLVEAQIKNERLKTLEEENRILKHDKVEDDRTWEDSQEVMDKLKEENKKLQEENDTLKQKWEDETCWEEFQEVMDKLKEQNKKLQEYKDLEKDILVSDVNEKQDKISLLEAENKKLQAEFDDKEHWGYAMVAYMDYADGWCHFDRWFGENIDEDDKKQEWVKEWMENTDYEDSDEEE